MSGIKEILLSLLRTCILKDLPKEPIEATPRLAIRRANKSRVVIRTVISPSTKISLITKHELNLHVINLKRSNNNPTSQRWALTWPYSYLVSHVQGSEGSLLVSDLLTSRFSRVSSCIFPSISSLVAAKNARFRVGPTKPLAATTV